MDVKDESTDLQELTQWKLAIKKAFGCRHHPPNEHGLPRVQS